MKKIINAQYKEENISGFAYQKENETLIELIRRFIERKIGKEIYSLKLDHQNFDGSAQFSGAVVKYNKHTGCCDLGTVTIYVYEEASNE